MAPLRRYLRLTLHSAIEVRIYLDNPADSARWLLAARDPALPRVLAAVRPLVLPKLREETARAKGKGKRRGVKDVVVREDFDVSVFLTELSTPHSILWRRRDLSGEGGRGVVREEREEREEAEGGGRDIAAVGDGDGDGAGLGGAGGGGGRETVVVSDGEEGEDGFQTQKAPSLKRKSRADGSEEDTGGGDDKKKMTMNTSYDGFRIYGRILCLVVKRKGISKGKQLVGGAGQAMMEDWITSTQMAQGQMMED
ncbi:hypothetical protein MMC13_000605 [Lambiella insularis]|nr:hypothetical protein [Lambiella insularis]